jgi:polyhydroxybutyrate depolymerase
MLRSERKSGVIFLVITLLLFSSQISFLSRADAANYATFGGDRQFQITLPDNYSASNSYPLIIGLAGYQQSSLEFNQIWNFDKYVDSKEFIYVAPDGKFDRFGNQFWNGAGCCDTGKIHTDDDAYILSIIQKISGQYSIDQNRIYLIGHSNGGFMVNELACRHANLFAGVIDIAGGNYSNLSQCKPTSPINYLEVWGSKDETFSGNHELGKKIAGAVTLLNFWRKQNGCTNKPIVDPIKYFYDQRVGKPATIKKTYPNCKAVTEFWEMIGSKHLPSPTPAFTNDLLDFLLNSIKANL